MCHNCKSHTTSSAGLRLDFWRSGESIGALKPVVTNRLEPGFNLTFTLQDLYPDISLKTEYAMQLHGYMALPNTSTTLQIVHAAGQATLHIGHCLFQVSDASGSGTAALSRGTKAILPSLTDGRLFHIQVTLTYAASKSVSQCCLAWRPILAPLLTLMDVVCCSISDTRGRLCGVVDGAGVCADE